MAKKKAEKHGQHKDKFGDIKPITSKVKDKPNPGGVVDVSQTLRDIRAIAGKGRGGRPASIEQLREELIQKPSSTPLNEAEADARHAYWGD